MRGGAAWGMLMCKGRYGVNLQVKLCDPFFERVRGVREDALYKSTSPLPLPVPTKVT